MNSHCRTTQDSCVTEELVMSEVKIVCINNVTQYPQNLGLIEMNEALYLTWGILFTIGSVLVFRKIWLSQFYLQLECVLTWVGKLVIMVTPIWHKHSMNEQDVMRKGVMVDSVGIRRVTAGEKNKVTLKLCHVYMYIQYSIYQNRRNKHYLIYYYYHTKLY